MDLSNGTVYTELYTELEGYERNGVCLLMEGSHVSPMQVVRELMARDECRWIYRILIFYQCNKEK